MHIVEDLTESLNLVENSHLFFIDTMEVCPTSDLWKEFKLQFSEVYSLYHNFCDRNIDTPQVSVEVE